jgi:hypothetical protein
MRTPLLRLRVRLDLSSPSVAASLDLACFPILIVRILPSRLPFSLHLQVQGRNHPVHQAGGALRHPPLHHLLRSSRLSFFSFPFFRT